jgi:hypothetical protein
MCLCLPGRPCLYHLAEIEALKRRWRMAFSILATQETTS